VDKAGRHRFGFSMGFPIRQAGRHHMAIQKKSSRMAKKKRIPEDLTEESRLMTHRIFARAFKTF